MFKNRHTAQEILGLEYRVDCLPLGFYYELIIYGV